MAALRFRRIHSHLSGGLRLSKILSRGSGKSQIYVAVVGLRGLFCGGHLNKVKRLKREPSKFVLLGFVINISSNLCVCEQPITHQNVLVVGY